MNVSNVLVPEIPPKIKPSVRVIQIDVDGCTAREYARRTGISEAGVRKMIANGHLPIIRTGEGKGCTIKVNLIALASKALEAEY